MNKGIFIKVIAVVLFLAAVAVLLHRTIFTVKRKDITPKVIVENTWSGYKHFFLDADGRVKRPKEGDTVSEGQAYAMLRAVWMDDKKTFDGCYRWTEENLSRKNKTGDNLLAWHWKDGKVSDWMPASDADVGVIGHVGEGGELVGAFSPRGIPGSRL